MSIYSDLIPSGGAKSPAPAASGGSNIYADLIPKKKAEPAKTGLLDKVKSFLGFGPKKDAPVTPEAPAPTTPAAPAQPSTSKNIFADLIPGGGAKSPFYAKTDDKGGAIGYSQTEKDASGKPFLAYRNPGDTATTTDKTRVASNFDPRVAQPLTHEEYYNPRADGLRAQLHDKLGIKPSDELDHAIALTVGGSNDPSNLRAIPAEENQAAGKFELELAQKLKAGKISYFDAQVADAEHKGVKLPWTGSKEKQSFLSKINSAFLNFKPLSPENISKTYSDFGKGIKRLAEPLANTKFMKEAAAGLNAESPQGDSLPERILKPATFGLTNPENIPFGVGEVVKQSKEYLADPNSPPITVDDFMKGMKDTGGIVAKFPVNAVLTIASAPPSLLSGGRFEGFHFTIPGLGEFTSAQAAAAKMVKNGSSWEEAALQETPNALFQTLFVIGLAQATFGSRPTVIGKGDAPAGVTVEQPLESFKLYKPPVVVRPLSPEFVKRMADQEGIDLSTAKDYNPKLPTFFRMTGKANGRAQVEVIQIKPSYVRTFLDKFNGDASNVPPEGTETLMLKEADTKVTVAPLKETAVTTPKAAAAPGEGSPLIPPVISPEAKPATEPAKPSVKPAEAPVVDAGSQGIKDTYAKVPAEKFDTEASHVISELSAAEAGKRLMGDSGEFFARRSTFPKWIPEPLRSKKIIDSVIDFFNPESPKYLTFPETSKQRGMFNAIIDELDRRLGVDTKSFRTKLVPQEVRSGNSVDEIRPGDVNFSKIEKPSKLPETFDEVVTYLTEKYPKGITLHHQTSADAAAAIKRSGFSSENEEVYFSVGKYDKSRSTSGGNDSVISITLHPKDYAQIAPDQGSYEGNSDEEQLADLFRAGFEGGDVTIPHEIANEYIKTQSSPKEAGEKNFSKPAVSKKAPESKGNGRDINPDDVSKLNKSIVPKQNRLFKGAKAVYKEIAVMFNPVSQAPAAGVDILMTRKGEYERTLFRTERAARFIKRMWDKQPEASRLEFMAKIERGEPITGPLADIAAMYRERLDNAHRAITEFKDVNFVENFFPHFWKEPGVIEEEFLPYARLNSRRPLEGAKSFLKKRVFQTIQDGIKAGYKPITTNPEELMQIYEQNVAKFVMANKIKEDMLDKGLWQFIRIGQQVPDNYTKINDNIAKIYLNPSITIQEAFDQMVMEGLSKVAKDLGVKVTRKMRTGGKDVLGFARGGREIVTKFASPDSVLAHELGHIIDQQFNLQSSFLRDPAIGPEITELARLRYEGQPASEKFKKYVETPAEKMAVMLEAYIHAPESFRKVAPKTYDRFVKFLESNPKIRPLLSIKPSLVLGANETQVNAGGIVIGGEHYAQKDVARLLNNYLSKDYIYDTAIGKGIMNVKNTLNAFQLGFSAFHLTMESLDTVVTKFSIGLSKLVRGDVVGGLVDMAKSPFSPASYFRSGQKFFNGDPQLLAIEKDLFTGGATLRERQYYKNTTLDTFLKQIRQAIGHTAEGSFFKAGKDLAGATIRLPMAAIEATMRPLFSYYIPRLKVGAFRDLFASELERQSAAIQKGDVSREKVARDVWNNIENRMGELNYDNLFWHRALKTSFMLTFRAVGWNLGTVREIGGAIFQDIPRESWSFFRGKRANFTPKMAYTLSLFAITAILGAVYQYLHTGKKPESAKDLFYPRNGAKDKSGEDYRVEFPTYLKDIYQYSHNPIRTIGNKLAPEFTMGVDLLTNKDYYGDYVRNTNDNLSTQMKQLAVFIGTQFVPFTFQQTNNLNKGQADLEQKAESFLGIIRAPKEVIQSEYQKQISELYTEQRGASGPKTPEQKDIQQAKQDATAAIKNGDYSLARELVTRGILTPTGYATFVRNAKLTTDQKLFKYLSNKNKQTVKLQKDLAK